MPYLKSPYIGAFPVVNRTASKSGDIYARHTTEEMLSGIVNKLIDTNGFVITTQSEFGLDRPFAFNIYGYYFKTQNDTVTDPSTISDPSKLEGTLRRIIELFDNIGIGDEIYAHAAIEKNGQWTELYGLDYTDDITPSETSIYYYSGVEFILKKANESAPVSTTTDFYIPLVKYVGDTDVAWESGWYVPDINYLKFNKNSFTISRIDGGDMFILD